MPLSYHIQKSKSINLSLCGKFEKNLEIIYRVSPTIFGTHNMLIRLRNGYFQLHVNSYTVSSFVNVLLRINHSNILFWLQKLLVMSRTASMLAMSVFTGRDSKNIILEILWSDISGSIRQLAYRPHKILYKYSLNTDGDAVKYFFKNP